MRRVGLLVVLVFVAMQLSACNMGESGNNDIAKEGVSSDMPSFNNIPYSKGPTGPPSVNGPTSPPEQVDAMIETEEMEFSLPTTAETEFKQ